MDVVQVPDGSHIHQGIEYVLGDFTVRVCRAILKPGEEVKGVMMDIEYMPATNTAAAHPALLVRCKFLYFRNASCYCMLVAIAGGDRLLKHPDMKAGHWAAG